MLSNPFYLNELIKIFIDDEKLPPKELLLDEIITKSFSLDQNKYDTDSIELKKLLKNIALSLEILGRNYLTNEEYYNLITDSNDRKLLKCSSLWLKNYDNIWSFKHNCFGEYLASQRMKEYSLEDIKKIVCYKNVDNKIKPSWVNTLAFLVNSEKRIKLADWILEYMPEFVAYIEDGIIDIDRKQMLFWNLFEQFKIKKIWIEYNIYTLNNLVSCKKDIQKLINEMIENYHYTSVGNALHILKNVNNLYGEEESLKEVLIKLSTNENYTEYNRAMALEVLAERKLLKLEEFKKIVEYNKKAESNNLRKSYYYCCNTLDIVDETIELLIERFDIECTGLKFSRTNDESVYFWDEHFEYEKTFSKIKDKKTIEIIIELFESKKLYDKENSKLLQNFMKSILRIYDNSDSFLEICLRLYFSYEKDYNYICMDYIINTIKTKNLLVEFFKRYMKENPKKSFREYEKIIDDDCLNYYYKEYENGLYDDEETGYILRCVSKKLESYQNLKKVYEERTGDIIQENKYIDYENIRLESKKYFIEKIFNRNEFNKFIEEFIKEFCEKYFCKEILIKDLFEYKHRSLTEESKKYYYLCIFLEKYLKDNEKINIEKMKKWDWDFVILGEIYEILKDGKNNNLLSEKQINIVKEICIKLLPTVNFRNAINYSNENSFSVSWLCIYLHYFMHKFNLKYPEKILLDMLEFDWQIDGKYVGIEYIVNNVSALKVKKRVIENLNTKKIRSNVLVNHIRYCLENDIDECIDSVGKHLLDKSNYFEERKIATQYLLKYMNVKQFADAFLKKSTISFQKEVIEYIPNCQKEELYDWLLEKNKRCKKIQDKMFFAKQLIYIKKEEGIQYYYMWAKDNKCSYTDNTTYRDINNAISEIDSPNMLDILINFIELTLDNNFRDEKFEGLYSSLSKAIKNIGTQNSKIFLITKNKLQYLFNSKNTYDGIGRIQYLIQDIEYEYIKNLQNEESIDNIKTMLKI